MYCVTFSNADSRVKLGIKQGLTFMKAEINYTIYDLYNKLRLILWFKINKLAQVIAVMIGSVY